MENILHKAIGIALTAHEGQTDRAGKPYAGHITRVMQAGTTIEERMAGILHDIVEDTHWTFDALLREGFPPEVVDAGLRTPQEHITAKSCITPKNYWIFIFIFAL